jgi:hypothetical protein
MPELVRPSGIVITHPDSLTIDEAEAPIAPPGGATRGKPARGAAHGGPPADEAQALIAALRSQDMTIADQFEIAAPPAPPAAATRGATRGSARAPAPSVQASVPLAPDEGAVILVEQGGEYRWHLPEREATPRGAARGATRGATRATRAPQAAVFTITIEAASAPGAPPPAKTRGIGGIVTRLVIGKATAFVIKYATKVAVDLAIKKLESSIQPGLVLITKSDPTTWTLLADNAPVTVPNDRAARVLLLVHGTFSSTKGSYGGLGYNARGRTFLDAVLKSYDLVIGYDHYSLSVDPEANARAMLARLQSIAWAQPPMIDAVAYSRGGLVYRSLVELVLPGAKWDAKMGRAVFVGCTNNGTKLADPENWHTFVDLYTNLAVAVCRGASLVPQATVFATVMAELVKGVGAFVKYLASYAASDEGGVPGIAAMDPDGAFVRRINQRQAGQPLPNASQYFAVTGDFRASDINPQALNELPATLVGKLADGLVDHLMGESNDLVVNTASMTSIDADGSHIIKDRFAFPASGSVYHTKYFWQDATADALTKWLLPDAAPKAVSLARQKSGSRKGSAPAPAPIPGVVTRKQAAPIPHAISQHGTRGPDQKLSQRPGRARRGRSR